MNDSDGIIREWTKNNISGDASHVSGDDSGWEFVGEGSVVEGAEKGDTLFDPNVLISFCGNFDVRHKIGGVTRRR